MELQLCPQCNLRLRHKFKRLLSPLHVTEADLVQLMMLRPNDMTRMRVGIETAAGRLTFSVTIHHLVDHRPTSIVGRVPHMVFMTQMQALMAMQVALSAVVVVVSNVAAATTVMSIVNARLRGASRVRLEMRMVTQSTLNGTTACRETTSGFSAAHCS
jgi:hypothetical protein